VAENQPRKKNRMTPELSRFAARFRDLCRACTHNGRRSTLSDAEFNKLALELFELQFNINAVFRNLCKSRQITPGDIDDWTRIPAVPTSAFKDADLTCLRSEERTTTFHSSGTTGQSRSRHFHSLESLAIYEDSLWPWFQVHVLSRSGGVEGDFEPAMLTPTPAEAPHSSLVYMFEVVRRKLGAAPQSFVGTLERDGSWILDFERAIAALRNAKARPIVLLGTAFSFVHLVEHLNERNLTLELPSGSRLMETGGYKGRSREIPKRELHGMLSERLGIPLEEIVCEYGMSELSSQAYDTVAGGSEGEGSSVERRFKFPPWVRTRIISPETGSVGGTGKPGLLQVFDLANIFSVLAIQTEDLVINKGDGFELVGRAELADRRGCSLMPA
jgi:hypothetical protein